MANFNHDDYIFSAFFVPDDHSPSMAITKELTDLHIAHYGRCWGITVTTKKENAVVLSLYGLDAVDYACTPFIAITHIVFGSRNNLEFELDNCDNVLTEMYSYIITRIAWSTECSIVHLRDVQIKYDSFLSSYNRNHISAIELIRPWIRKYSPTALSEIVSSQICSHLGTESNEDHTFRLVTPVFEPSFVENWLKYGWRGPFFLGTDTCFIDRPQRLVTIRLDKHPGLEDEKEDIFKVIQYQRVTYMGRDKCYNGETFSVKFCREEADAAKVPKGGAVVSISLTTEMLEFVSKHGNRSKFIQKLVTDEMGREETAEHYKPLLNSMIAGIKAKQEKHHREDDKTLPEVTQARNASSNGAFHLFLAKWHQTTDCTFNNWMAVFEHTSKIEEVDRHFLGSSCTYNCLELTVRESANWSPLRCDLMGGINILVSPTKDINDKTGIVYKCVALNSEIRRNAVNYSDEHGYTSTIRLLIIDRLSRDAGFEADLYPLDDAIKQATDNMNQPSRYLLFQKLMKDIVIR